MTEADWLVGRDPTPMLVYLRGRDRRWTRQLPALFGFGTQPRPSRKARLFACACVRRIRPLPPDPRPLLALTTAERFADGRALATELEQARTRAAESPWGPAARAATRTAWQAAWSAALGAAQEAVHAAEWTATDDDDAAERERAAQADLVRDIFGNPFRPSELDAAWLEWAGGAVVKQAKTCYDSRRFDTLPALADALQYAGCVDARILGHCRRGGVHVRGCWVVDLLLQRE